MRGRLPGTADYALHGILFEEVRSGPYRYF